MNKSMIDKHLYRIFWFIFIRFILMRPKVHLFVIYVYHLLRWKFFPMKISPVFSTFPIRMFNMNIFLNLHFSSVFFFIVKNYLQLNVFPFDFFFVWDLNINVNERKSFSFFLLKQIHLFCSFLKFILGLCSAFFIDQQCSTIHNKRLWVYFV